MTIKLLDLVEAIRERLDDLGWDRGVQVGNYYASWQEDDTPCLWKNKELIRLIKQTIVEIGRRVPIRGRVESVPLLPGQRTITMMDMLSVDSIIRESDGEQLVRTTLGEIEFIDRFWREGRTYLYEDSRRQIMTQRAIDGSRVVVSDWKLATGKPTHYLLEENNITLFPFPDEDHIETITIRYSKTYSTNFEWVTVATEAIPTFELSEVPDSYFRAIIAGVTALAFLKRDTETESITQARLAEAEFTAMIGPPRSARLISAEKEWAGGAIRFEPRAIL